MWYSVYYVTVWKNQIYHDPFYWQKLFKSLLLTCLHVTQSNWPLPSLLDAIQGAKAQNSIPLTLMRCSIAEANHSEAGPPAVLEKSMQESFWHARSALCSCRANAWQKNAVLGISLSFQTLLPPIIFNDVSQFKLLCFSHAPPWPSKTRRWGTGICERSKMEKQPMWYKPRFKRPGRQQPILYTACHRRVRTSLQKPRIHGKCWGLVCVKAMKRAWVFIPCR